MTLNAQAFDLQNQVGALAGDDLHELRLRLEGSWPATPFKDLVTVDCSRVTLAPPAAAWLFLAPAAELRVTDEQWAQLATNPVIYSEQSD